MKQFMICSLKQFKSLLLAGKVNTDKSYALISSSYPLDMTNIPMARYSFELYDDIDYDWLGRCFSFEAAKHFADAIKNNNDVNRWYFICDGGVRRSAAIAAAALRYWGDEEEELAIWADPRREPNVLVYEMLCSVLKPIDAVDLDLRIYINRNAIKQAMRKEN